MSVQLLRGNCLDVLRTLPDCSVDSIVTDPPYGLSFMGKTWDYDVPSVEVWAECLRVLKPGGHLLAFAGTRTQHRMAVRIEDAGFEIRDMMLDAISSDTHAQRFLASLSDEQARAFGQVIAESNFGGMLAWVYGSGFPKSLDVSKAIDKRGGASVAWFGPWFRKWREDNGVTQKQVAALFPSKTGGLTGCVANWELGFNMPTPEQFNLIRDTFGLPFASVEEAEREVVGTKKVVPGVAFGSDGPNELEVTAPATEAAQQWQGWGTALKPALEPITVARKPLIGTVAENVLAHGTGALNIDGCRVAMDDALGGGAYAKNPTERASMWGADAGNSWVRGGVGEFVQPTGRWPANLIHDGSEEVLAAFPAAPGAQAPVKGTEPSSSTANAYGHFARAASARCDREPSAHRRYTESGGTDFAMKPGARRFDDGSAARFFYCAKASRADRGEGNDHPTVKPTDLMRYLCRLVTPPGGVVLDPFMGSGSTGRGAALEGFGFIGIEREAEYVALAAARIAAVAVETVQRPAEAPSKAPAPKPMAAETGQGALW